MSKPALISLTALVVAGVGAALLWRAAGTDEVLVAQQDDNPIADRPTHAKPAAGIQSAVPSDQSTSPPGEGTSQAMQPPAAGKAYSEFQVRDDPESLAQYKETLQREYESKARALTLTPEEVSRIVDTLVRLRQESLREIREIKRTNPAGLWLEDEANEMLRLQQLARQREDVEMMALLGGKYTQWKELTLAPDTLASVDNLQTLMEISDVRPLTSERANSLASALNAERVRILRDSGVEQIISPGTDTTTRMRQEIQREQRNTPENNRRLEVVASRLLDPQQLAIYRRMLDDAYNKRLGALQGALAAREASGK